MCPEGFDLEMMHLKHAQFRPYTDDAEIDSNHIDTLTNVHTTRTTPKHRQESTRGIDITNVVIKEQWGKAKANQVAVFRVPSTKKPETPSRTVVFQGRNEFMDTVDLVTSFHKRPYNDPSILAGLPNLTEGQLADLLLAVNRETHLAGRPAIVIPELTSGGCYLCIEPITAQINNVFKHWRSGTNDTIDLSPEALQTVSELYTQLAARPGKNAHYIQGGTCASNLSPPKSITCSSTNDTIDLSPEALQTVSELYTQLAAAQARTLITSRSLHPGWYLCIEPITAQINNVSKHWRSGTNDTIDLSPEALQTVSELYTQLAAAQARTLIASGAKLARRDPDPEDDESKGQSGTRPSATWARANKDTIDDYGYSSDEEPQDVYEPVLVDLYEDVENVEGGFWPISDLELTAPAAS
ncbi:hypothetical protein DFS34DRAFT_648620 [Phlyctochytrium arcticum]|nr:hypothetical protein DFS34DRAFT_648620 [Phlyctochytrium arcticum]